MTAAATDADREMARQWNSEHGGCCETGLAQAFAAHRIQARKEAIEEAAAYLDGYAGGHYMAQSCAAAIRALGEQS